PEAALGVVFVAGDDDCSIDDPAFFADGDAPLGKFRCFREGVHCDDDAVPEGPQSGCAPRASSAVMADVDDEAGFLRALKADPAAVTVTTLAGEPDRVALARTGDGLEVSPACTDAVNDVTPRPGIRLGAFAGRMRGSVAGLCEQTLEEAGTPAGLDLRRALGHRCLEGRILDVKPWEPGVQFQCEVEAVSAGGEVTALAACPNPNHVFDEDGPCWAIKPGPAQCGDFPSQLALQVNWGGDDKLTTPPGVTTRVRCAVEDDDPLD
ncbi:MAG: hypothetical protein KC464_33570, partial [Myxococcales bacterium]|nr:hypothetical protein [Myxococcales bacterium]